MPDLRQLKTFVVSADMNSFSKAAQILYTTQSSVSKIVASLEQELNTHLFRRGSHGIELTDRGRVLYRYAVRVLADMEEIEHIKGLLEDDTIHICCHPSSWFARRFVEFYNLHASEDPHFDVRNVTTDELLERIASEKDELGFLYVFRNQEESFRYRLEQLNLEMIPLREVGPMLYLGTGHPCYGEGSLSAEQLEELRLVQMYEDEFAGCRSYIYDAGEECVSFEPKVAVRTNSDYIMQAFLHGSALANISGESHPDRIYEEANRGSEVRISHDAGKAVYGCIRRRDVLLKPLAQKLLDYIRDRLETE